MSIQELFSKFDDYMKKIDQKTKNEDYKRIESTEKNLNDLKILLMDSKRIVHL
jgi:CHASE3 domain sensor protein